MNWLIIISGFIALFTTVGHFTMGSKQFLQPMLGSDFDAVPKKVMHCVFHYVSTFLLLSTAALLLAGFRVNIGNDTTLLVRFISVNYAVFAVWQIILAATSDIPNPLFKLFQWTFFVIIAVMGWIGS